MNLNQEICKTRTRALLEGVDIGRKKALDELEKWVDERIDLMVKDVKNNGGDTCSKARLRELNKTKEEINRLRFCTGKAK